VGKSIAAIDFLWHNKFWTLNLIFVFFDIEEKTTSTGAQQ